jgi:hypothetical protein
MKQQSIDFDALVLEMRTARTTASMMVVYEHLFRLEEWFLPNDPEKESIGTPMQWRFPEGRNPTPCILVYTDFDRAKRHADRVAASFGKAGEVMSVSVEDAVKWMLFGDLGVSWASVNYGEGSENFPLYFYQVEKLACAFDVFPKSTAVFFPPAYKQFEFQEGDLLANQRETGKYAISKVLKVDRIIVKAGESISIQGQSFTAPVDDFLLVVSCAYGAPQFDSLDQARVAAASGMWSIVIAHVANRSPGAAAGQIRVGCAPVTEGELAGYRIWREAFDKGEAGVF